MAYCTHSAVPWGWHGLWYRAWEAEPPGPGSDLFPATWRGHKEPPFLPGEKRVRASPHLLHGGAGLRGHAILSEGGWSSAFPGVPVQLV